MDAIFVFSAFSFYWQSRTQKNKQTKKSQKRGKCLLIFNINGRCRPVLTLRLLHNDKRFSKVILQIKTEPTALLIKLQSKCIYQKKTGKLISKHFPTHLWFSVAVNIILRMYPWLFKTFQRQINISNFIIFHNKKDSWTNSH